MATTWGQHQWGSNSWSSDENNITPSSFSLSADLGSVLAVSSVGWGAKTWSAGEWGTLANAIVLQDGFSLSANLGTVAVTAEINIGWGGLAWNEGEWGDLANPNIDLTGFDLTSALASVTVEANANVSVTGQELTSETDGAVAGTSVLVIPTNNGATTNVGSAFGGEVNVVEVTSPADDPWGNTRVGWGNGLWGTGDGITLTGTTDIDVVGDAIAILTGVEATGGTGQLEYAAIYQVTNGSENTVEFTAYNQAQLSTAQQKFGTASLLLDGTDDYVESNSNVNLSSGDFTIDLWIRPDNVTGYKGIWQSGTSTTEQSYLLGNTVYWTVTPSTIITTAVTVNANEWTMLSYERQGNTHRIYKNGTLADTATTANKQDNGPFSIGKNGFGDFDGYIDEVRVSDIARYGGSSFTEPTGAFTPDSNTTFLLHMDGANGSTNILDDAPGVTIARFDIGNYFAGEVVEVQVTTASAQPWGETAWGDGQWGQSVGTDIGIGGETIGVPSQEVEVTGQALSASIETPAITGDANVTVSGIEIESLQGNEEAFTDVTVEILQRTLNTISIGDHLAGISIEVTPTGVTATGNTGTMGINAWAVVEPNASTTWSVVDKAAA